MTERFPRTLLDRSLRNLRDLWHDLVTQSWLPNGREVHPDLPNGDLPRIREQMKECLAARGGEVSARLRAATLGHTYLRLNAGGRGRFLRLLADEFRVDREAVAAAIEGYQQAKEDEIWAAEDRLRSSLLGPRVRLLTQFNELPEGTKFLVNLRTDLLALAPQTESVRALDRDLMRILTSWFDVGFLELQRISWNSPASLLEKLISYEAVHEIESWSDLRNRLESDRRCYAFFHPHMPGEPLIFVEVALTEQMAGSIQELLDESAPQLDPRKASAAIFYSISNTQKGLSGISFGSFLIKRVVDDLARDLPRLKTFATLSPMPRFSRWLDQQLSEDRSSAGSALLLPKERTAVETAAGSATSLRLRELLATPDWSRDASITRALQAPLLRLCARYLTEAKRGEKPLDPVARFHLGNGARIERLNWLGDVSVKGLGQSHGIMVNYGYRLADIERNHEAYQTTGEITLSPQVRKVARG